MIDFGYLTERHRYVCSDCLERYGGEETEVIENGLDEVEVEVNTVGAAESGEGGRRIEKGG